MSAAAEVLARSDLRGTVEIGAGERGTDVLTDVEVFDPRIGIEQKREANAAQANVRTDDSALMLEDRMRGLNDPRFAVERLEGKLS